MKFRNNVLWIGCLTAAAHTCALTLGPTQGQVVLGAPLDIRVSIEPDAGQTLASSCIEAEAHFGEALARLTTDLLPPSTLRIRSQQPVNEPLVDLRITAGCGGRMARSYTLFADPPKQSTTAATAAQSPIHIAPAARPAPTVPATQQPRPRTTPAAQKKAPAAAKASTQAAKPASVKAAAAAASAAVPAALLSPEELRPVLRMDTLFLFPDGANAESSPSARNHAPGGDTIILPGQSATPQAQDKKAANAQSEQLLRLEKQLTTLLQQQKQDRAHILRLSEQLANAQTPNQTLWLYVLLCLLLLALTTIALLLRRFHAERALAQDRWSAAVREAQEATAHKPGKSIATSAAFTRKIDSKTSEEDTAAQDTPAASASDPWTKAEASSVPPVAAPDVPASAADVRQANAFLLPQATNTQSTDASSPAPAQSAYSTITSQDFLSTQEQAEFFASIGEYDEAIGLLQNHIAQAGPTSPLPYLKLLEFFYQLSRTESFEQTRQALQEHFNIQAPTLAKYHSQGQDLLHGYPQLLEPIEALWPSDEVLALLEGLLHYPVQGKFDAPVPRLDPAAFHELLLLYNIARDTPANARGSMVQRRSTAAEALCDEKAALDPAPTAAVAETAMPVPDDAPDGATLDALDLQLDLPTAPVTGGADSPAAPADAESLAPPASASLDLLEDLNLDLHAPDTPAADAPLDPTPAPAPLELDLDGLNLEAPADRDDTPRQP